jgi:hypothetical protein
MMLRRLVRLDFMPWLVQPFARNVCPEWNAHPLPRVETTALQVIIVLVGKLPVPHVLLDLLVLI